MTSRVSRRTVMTGAAGLGLVGLGVALEAREAHGQAKPLTLLNVSYDPTRELYKAYNPVFAADWKRKTGQDVSIEQSHGGSGKQALSVINGLQADVVTLGIATDIDAIVDKAHLITPGWAARLPHGSTPYTSTVVFLVRKGNPKKVKDWPDLVRGDVQIITPNPKTSSGGRWNYLAAYAWALKRPGGGEAFARAYIAKLYAAAPVLDTGARGSTVTFTQRGLGDVLLAWENEAFLALDEMGADKFEIVTPSVSIFAEPPVTWVDTVTARHGATEVAQAYLRGLYSDKGQEIVAKNHYRPRNRVIAAKYAAKFPHVPLIDVRTIGGLTALQKSQFADGGVFDQVYKPHG